MKGNNMAYIKNYDVWREMARRKVKFHKDENWNDIKLWGLFYWGEIKRFLKSGLLKTNYRKEHKIVWVQPSQEAWEKHIKPIVDKLEAIE
jgi:hypothetical protein